MIGASPVPVSTEDSQEEVHSSGAGSKKEEAQDVKKEIPEWDLQKTERKTQRKQILLYPSVHDRAMEKCKRTGISLNHAINELLGRWADTE